MLLCVDKIIRHIFLSMPSKTLRADELQAANFSLARYDVSEEWCAAACSSCFHNCTLLW